MKGSSIFVLFYWIRKCHSFESVIFTRTGNWYRYFIKKITLASKTAKTEGWENKYFIYDRFIFSMRWLFSRAWWKYSKLFSIFGCSLIYRSFRFFESFDLSEYLKLLARSYWWVFGFLHCWHIIVLSRGTSTITCFLKLSMNNGNQTV